MFFLACNDQSITLIDNTTTVLIHFFNLTVTVLQTAVTPFYSMGHGMLVEARLGVRPSSLAWVAQWVGQ